MTSFHAARPYWLAAIVIGMGGVCIWGASFLPGASRYAGIGPGAFAMIVGVGLVLLGGILAIQILRGATFEAQATESADTDRPVNHKALALALIAAAVPIVTIQALGLPLTAMISFTLVARAFGSRTLWLDLGVGLVLGSLSWLLFNALGLQLGDFLPFIGG
ncbi:Integral membrane protein [Ketogulonicigenium robustum]|uniref:Integral membrane protein n=1 Tax=Ketogulonicigenium robustum TaxID=92947 RepID=A0A1W6P022_9RHOB|nr:tripartite tricarboxylate transporter TctB family protein [Ketogulonicigenium robustum]ARO14855.1 Integral membrane protein [Ketogulonicigenium robustum]